MKSRILFSVLSTSFVYFSVSGFGFPPTSLLRNNYPAVSGCQHHQTSWTYKSSRILLQRRRRHFAVADILGEEIAFPMEDEELIEIKKFTETDRKYMRRALSLAAQALGKTRPNPAVGCIILDSKGDVVGEGFHPKAGEPHAEVFALREAGEKARGGTAYVTLEPCNHHGKTPPCVDALLKAGVKRVVAGMVDPFPLCSGKGLERLQESGVEVEVGCEEEKCRDLNRAFIHRVQRGTPLGFLPLAYHEHCFVRPGREPLHMADGPKVLAMIDAVVVDGSKAGLAALEELEVAGDLGDSVLRVVVIPPPGTTAALAVSDWTAVHLNRNKQQQHRTIILTSSSTTATPQQLQQVKETQQAEVVNLPQTDPVSVADYLQELGMLSALWLIEPNEAVRAVKEGVIQDLWVSVALKEADELDGVGLEEDPQDFFLAKQFGRPMKVSVMSCDALDTQACVLSFQVDDDDDKTTPSSS